MVKISKTHHQTKTGQIKKNPSTTQIGDGKLPNKYWVSVSNDFFLCEDGSCDWASDSKKFKSTGKTLKSFNTFREALEYIDRNVFINSTPKIGPEEINFISIEDRLSGEIWSQSLYGYKDEWGWKFEIETHNDTRFTEEQMAKRGQQFR